MDTDPTRHGKIRSRLVGALCWAAVAAALPLSLGWLAGPVSYWLDLFASLQLLIVFGTLGLALAALLMRRKRQALVLVMLAGLGAYPVLSGRRWVLPEIDYTHKDERVLRVVSLNINPQSEHWPEDLRALLGLDADVIVLLEVHYMLGRAIRNKGFLDGTPYSHWTSRPWVESETSQCYMISKWPMRVIDYGGDPKDKLQHVHAVIEHPGGEVVVGLMHPLSPRTEHRWREGNRVVWTQGDEAKRLHESTGLAVVMGADLNAGPGQYRARVLRGAGLRMSKPLLRIGGSFPADGPMPFWARPQIDDVWTMGGIRVLAWEMRGTLGSDHRAVVTDLVLDPHR